VQTAIPTLSDSELANLSTRATDAQQKFSAGVLGTSMLTLIIVLIAIIIIVAIIH
jgi:small-conductance mechanosensitive channel